MIKYLLPGYSVLALLMTLALSHPAYSSVVLEVENAYATPTFALAKMGAGYFTLHNSTDEEVAITAISLSENVANRIEMHETFVEGDMAKMRQLKLPFKMNPGETVEFKPKGKHLMLMGLKKPLESGMTFSVTLELSSGDRLSSGVAQEIEITVRDSQEKESEHHHHHH